MDMLMHDVCRGKKKRGEYRGREGKRGRQLGNEWHANRVKVVCAKFANILQNFSMPGGSRKEGEREGEGGITTLLLQSKFDR